MNSTEVVNTFLSKQEVAYYDQKVGTWDMSVEFAISQAQANFLDDHENRHPAFVSGLGGGKTYSGLMKGLDLTLVNKGLPMVMMEPTFNMVEKILWPALFDEILKQREIPYEFNKTSKTLKFPWGSEIWFMTAEDPERIAGTQVASGYVDEVGLVSELAWKNLNNRVRHPRAAILQLYATMTPDAPGWTHDKWGRLELFGEPLPKGYAVYQGKTADNWTLEGYEETLLDEWDEIDAQSRVYGKFSASRKGRVYYSFEPRRNISHKIKYDPGLPLHVTFDFNLSPGMHVLVCQQRRDKKQLWVLDEIHATGMNLEKACRVVLDKYAPKQKAPVRVFGDANGRHLASKKSYYHIIQDIFRKGILSTTGFKFGVGVKVPHKNPSIADSVAATRGALCSANGRVSLLLHPNCRRLINDFHNVRTSASYAEETGRGFRGNPDDIFKGDSKLTHSSDAIRYWIYQVQPIRDRFKRQVDYEMGKFKTKGKSVVEELVND